MKTILITFILFLKISLLFSQSVEEYNYISIQPIVVTSYDLINSTSTGTKKLLKEGIQFRLIGDVVNDDSLGPVYVIQVLDIVAGTDKYKTSAEVVNSDDNDRFFCFPSSMLNETMAKKRYMIRKNISPSLGTITIPIKIRPKLQQISPLDYTTDVSIGGSVGAKTRISRYHPYYFNLVAVFGATTINIDSATTHGYANGLDSKLAAFTPAIGGIIELDKFQIGIVTGCDIASGQIGQNWIYSGRIWWSFGIGFQFLANN